MYAAHIVMCGICHRTGDKRKGTIMQVIVKIGYQPYRLDLSDAAAVMKALANAVPVQTEYRERDDAYVWVADKPRDLMIEAPRCPVDISA